jgi:GNAT superfamily N-acetyltransferase
MTISVSITASPSDLDLAVIRDGLSTFNDEDAGKANRVPLGVFMRDTHNNVVGGISGYTAWGWLYIQWLWLDEAWRGQGLAAELIDAAEAEARQRGCHAVWIDTFNPVALKVYRKRGYEPFGALEDFPKGRTRTFLQKKL